MSRQDAVSYDFSGWATRNDLKCTDGRTIRKNAFRDDDGAKVPLVWQHQSNIAENVVGHAILHNRDEGVYAYCSFNDTPTARHAKELVRHGDISSLSIHAVRLKQNHGDVIHGTIKEVSLVLAGANPGAVIDNIIMHSDGTYYESDDEAFIYVDSDDAMLTLSHAESEEEEEEDNKMAKKDSEKTIKDVLDTFDEDQNELLEVFVGKAASGDEEPLEKEEASRFSKILEGMSEEQQNALFFIIAKAKEEASKGNAEAKHSDDYDELEHSYNEGDYDMDYNVFEGMDSQRGVSVSHADQEEIFKAAKNCGSLKMAVEGYCDTLQHSITNIDALFPDPTTVSDEPAFVMRQNAWVSALWDGLHKTPFSRIRSVFANITEAEARAKGYIKGKQKKEEVFGLLKRITDPQTVYKLQKMNRDDVLDITSFDVVAWLKREMRILLNEELARAVLVGDGREAGSEEKISESNIRPVWKDDDFYTIKRTVNYKAAQTNYDKADLIVEAALRARTLYMGTGTPEAFFPPEVLTTMLLAKDTTGRRIYNSIKDLTDTLRVSRIHEVPVMEGQVRTDSESHKHSLLGIIFNPYDYDIGSNKGGEINFFDDFDIDYNRYSYLIETRCSGALVRPYAAIAIEQDVD